MGKESEFEMQLKGKEFISTMQEKHPNIIIVGEYKGSTNKIEWICSRCGKSQFSLPSNLLKPEATGLCRKCFNLQLAEGRKKGHEQFLQELKAIHPDIKVTGVYQGNNHEIEWECSNCGKKQVSLALNLLKPNRSPYCESCRRYFASLSTVRQSAKKFYEELNQKENPPILLDEYRGLGVRLRFKCSVCGHEWESRPRDILKSKHPCPICASRSLAISNETFIQRLSEVNPYVMPLEKYVRQDQHINCRCLRCGHEWPITPGALLSGNGCPMCSHSGTSFFEQFLFLTLQYVLGEDCVVSRDRKAIGSELDVYVPEKNLAFEYGAWFYHKNRFANDLKKVKKCKQNGIRLIRIYDACGDENVGGEDVLSYSKNIAIDLNDSINAVKQILSLSNIECQIERPVFLIISDKAYKLSRKMTSDQFKEIIASLQPNIEVLGEYKSNDSKIKCRCSVCGHIWNPTPHGLLAGYGCRNCYRLARTKDEKTYLAQVRQVNPSIEVLEPYIASNKRILAKCTQCGHQWRPYASTLLHGYGCSVCKKMATAKKAIDDIIRINPDIEILGKYQGISKPIKVRCKTCGKTWNPIVDNLVRNSSHCPECSRKNTNAKLRMSTDEFVQRLSSISPTIEVVVSFNGTNNRVDVRCKQCGYEWSPKAMDLLTGRQCRKCKYKEQAIRSRRTPEQFIQEMKDINPDILVLGTYTKACEHIEVECKKCGRKWNPCASSLLAGTGCPSCSKKRKGK